MRTIYLNQLAPKDFPVYVEFLSKYYLCASPMNGDEAYLIEVSTTKAKSTLVVTANREYNVLTEEEYKQKLSGQMLVLEAEAARVTEATSSQAASMNYHATDLAEVAESKEQAKNLLAGQLASMRAKKKE